MVYVCCMFNVPCSMFILEFVEGNKMTWKKEKGRKNEIKYLRFALLAGDVKQLSLSFWCLSPTWTHESTELERYTLVWFFVAIICLMHIMCVNCKWETNWVIIIMLLLSGTGMRSEQNSSKGCLNVKCVDKCSAAHEFKEKWKKINNAFLRNLYVLT